MESPVMESPADSTVTTEKSEHEVTLSHVNTRKELWKRKAIQLETQLGGLQTELEKTKKELLRWKKKRLKEAETMKWWKLACLGLGFLVVVILTTMFVTSMMSRSYEPPRIQTSGTFQQTPNSVLASVMIRHGKAQASGTIVSKGDSKAALLTAAHPFKNDKPGARFWVYYPDGTYTIATLVCADYERDLAIATVASNTILGHAYIPDSLPKDEYTAVGYTNGQGPNFKNINYSGYIATKNKLWVMDVKTGSYGNGGSGGGVFSGNALIGVAVERDASYIQNGLVYTTPRMYVVPHETVISFLYIYKDLLGEAGEWTTPPETYGGDETRPPLWKPNSNIPIFLPDPEPLMKKPSEVPLPK